MVTASSIGKPFYSTFSNQGGSIDLAVIGSFYLTGDTYPSDTNAVHLLDNCLNNLSLISGRCKKSSEQHIQQQDLWSKDLNLSES